MAAGHPYGTEAQIKNRLGRDLVLKLKQKEGNDAEAVYAEYAANAARWVDMKLSRRWPVPFEREPSSPHQINLLWLYRVCAELLADRFADSDRAKWYRGEADALVKTLTAEGAELVASDGTTLVGRLSESAGAVGLSGEVSEDGPIVGYDEDGNDLMRNL